MKNIKSINTTLIFLLLPVIVITMSIFLGLYYYQTKTKLYTALEKKSHLDLAILTKSLTPYIESYAITEYKKLMKNEFANRDLVAIVTQDMVSGQILRNPNFATGIARKPDGSLKEFSSPTLPKALAYDPYLIINKPIYSSQKEKLGEITLYYTDHFIQDELLDIMLYGGGVITIVTIIIVLFLFLTISFFIIKPILAISKVIENHDKNGIPNKPLPKTSIKEFSVLVEAIDAMIYNIKESRATLKTYIERYELILEGINDGIWDWDISKNKVYFSKRWKEMLGYKEEEFASTPEDFFNIIHPKDQPKLAQALKEHFKNPLLFPYAVDIRIKTATGEYKWILTRGKAILGSNGEPIRMLGSHTDISDLKALQIQISKEQEFISNIIENANVIVAVINNEGRMIQINPYGSQFVGYTQDEIRSEPYFWTRFLPTNNHHEIIGIFEKAHHGEITKHFRNSWISKNGEEKLFEWSNTLVINHENQFDYVIAIGIDVTQENLYSEQLLQQKKELETIFDTTKDGLAVLDLGGKFVQVNRACSKITGLSKEELETHTIFDFTSYEEKEKTHQMFQKIIKEGHVEDFEKTCTTPKKESIVSISLSLMPDHLHILTSIKDISDKKVFEEQAKLAAMGDMIGNIAHQWRQPLSVITTVASGISFKHSINQFEIGSLEPNMELIVKQAQYLSQTIEDFRSYIRGDEQEQTIMLSEIIDKTISLIKPSIVNNHIELIINTHDDGAIVAFGNTLVQSFINIINNAKDAMKEHIVDGSLRVLIISTHISDATISLSFQDNGGGIPSGIISKIFEPYFTTKHQSVGTGIGLSMTYSIIKERHNGEITVANRDFIYNDTPCHGACFTITLPLSQAI